jgi:hypothetical protein
MRVCAVPFSRGAEAVPPRDFGLLGLYERGAGHQHLSRAFRKQKQTYMCRLNILVVRPSRLYNIFVRKKPFWREKPRDRTYNKPSPILQDQTSMYLNNLWFQADKIVYLDERGDEDSEGTYTSPLQPKKDTVNA